MRLDDREVQNAGTRPIGLHAIGVLVRRLGVEDVDLAWQTLRLMADVSEDPSDTLTDAYLSLASVFVAQSPP